MVKWKIGFFTVFLISLVFGGYVYSQLRAIDVEKLSDDLYVLRGMGGNTAVLKTDAGTIIVDTMTTGIQGERIKTVAKKLTGMDPVMLINTHYHLDHTHGNPAFEPGTRVLSTARTLFYLERLDEEFWTGDTARLLPNETFSDRQTLTIGGKTIELIHPGAGHTDGDLVVLFKDERVLHMGDLFFNKHYPNIDLEAGGTVQEWPTTLDNLDGLDFDRVIPGHGDTSDRAGLQQFKGFVTQLGALARTALVENIDKEAFLKNTDLSEDANYEPIKFVVSLGLDREFVLRRAWEEVHKDFTLVD